MIKVYKGDIVYSKSFEDIEVLEDSYIAVEDKSILQILESEDEISGEYELVDYSGKLIIPSFVDLHLHAVQYANMGLGYDKELLPWLKAYTFPEEKKFKDLEYAVKVFKNVISDLISFGTLRSCMFSSLHLEATKLLFDECVDAGISAYIGKVNMDRNGLEGLEEKTDESVSNTLTFVKSYSRKSELVKPIITPRFVPSCTDFLMDKLGNISSEYNICIQSHLNENVNEVEWVKSLSPESKNYLDAYGIHDLLNDGKTIMAHCIYNTQDEVGEIIDRNIYVAHCPTSNSNLRSGIMRTKEMVKKGIKVGLGSDIAGGETLCMMRVMAEAIKLSKILSIQTGNEDDILTVDNAFFLATRGGGEFFGDCGSFEKGFSFDALIIDDSRINRLGGLSPRERLEKFIYLGDDREVCARYLEGKRIDCIG